MIVEPEFIDPADCEERQVSHVGGTLEHVSAPAPMHRDEGKPTIKEWT